MNANDSDEEKINMRVKQLLSNLLMLSSHYLVILQFRPTTLLFLHALRLSRRKDKLDLPGREYATRNFRFKQLFGSDSFLSFQLQTI